MVTEWRAKIVQMAHWKQLAADADQLSAVPWHLPRLAASEDQIREAEERVGPLPSDYREFLSYANGWEGFLLSANLFGTGELVGGMSEEVLARDDVQWLLQDADVALPNAIAIGAATEEADVFVAVSPNSNVLPSTIFWFGGSEIERHPNFAQFFDAMIAYNERIARKLTEQVRRH